MTTNLARLPLAEIKTWARTQGYDVPVRGQVSRDIKTEWLRTHGHLGPADDEQDATPGPRRPLARGDDVVLLDGTIDNLPAPRPPTYDDQQRIICRGCDQWLNPTTLACGCDPGFLDDDGVPLDERYRHLGPITGAA